MDQHGLAPESHISEWLNTSAPIRLHEQRGRVLVACAFQMCGVACLDAENIALILDVVRTYDRFDEDIDPYGEHDMGRFTVRGEEYYWKIDYYDRNLDYHAPDPADPEVTTRVLKIMRVEEY
jgi:hypothetical protein